MEGERAKVVTAIPEDLARPLPTDRKKTRRSGCGGKSAEKRAQLAGRGFGPHVFQILSRDDNQQELYHCELCTRILYYIEPPAATQAAAQATGAQTSEK